MSPVVAAPLLVGITVVLAGVVGVLALDHGPPEYREPRVLSAEASADGEVALTLDSGPAIDVSAVDLKVSVEGDPLDHQPPVPFFSATGFHPGPTGPFNSATDPGWEAGERASFQVAGTNSPSLEAGDTVEIEVVQDDSRIALIETTVQAA